MTENTDLERDELAASLRCLARRTQALARIAPRRVEAGNRMRQCLGDVLSLLESATQLLYRPNARVPSLHDGSHAPRPIRSADENGDLHGSTRALSISEIIDFLGTCQKSGVLKIVNQTETFSIQFQEGTVVHASSDNSPPGHRLGDILVERGYLTPESFSVFLAHNARTGERIGVALEREEILTRDQLADALETQIQFLFHRLFATSDATFSFHERVIGSYDHRVRMSVMSLLLESARAQDEALR